MKKHINHVVIIGWDNAARHVLEQIVAAERKVIIITNNQNDVGIINETYASKYVEVLCVDLKQFDKIQKANIEQAIAVMINLQDDTQKLEYIIGFKKAFRAAKLVVPINNQNLKDTFFKAGVTFPLAKDEIAAKMLSSYLFEQEVAVYCEDLLATATEESDYDIQQYKVTADNPFVDSDYRTTFVKLKQVYNVILIGLAKYTGEERQLLKNPPDNTKIEQNDYLILVLNGRAAHRIREEFHVEEGFLLQ